MCEFSRGVILEPPVRSRYFAPKIRLGKVKSSLQSWRGPLLAALYILMLLLDKIGWMPLLAVYLIFIAVIVCVAWGNTCHLVVWLEVAVLFIGSDLNLWRSRLFLLCGPLLSCLVIAALGRKSPVCQLLGRLEPFMTRLRRRLPSRVMWVLGTVADVARTSYDDYSRNVSIVDMPCATATEQTSLYCSSRRVLGDLVQELLPEDSTPLSLDALGGVFSNVFGSLGVWGSFYLDALGDVLSSVFGYVVVWGSFSLDALGDFFSSVFEPLGTWEDVWDSLSPNALGGLSSVFEPLGTWKGVWNSLFLGGFLSSVLKPLGTCDGVWDSFSANALGEFPSVFGSRSTWEGVQNISVASAASDHWASQVLPMAVNITIPY